jgi:hypothetical protein
MGVRKSFGAAWGRRLTHYVSLSGSAHHLRPVRGARRRRTAPRRGHHVSFGSSGETTFSDPKGLWAGGRAAVGKSGELPLAESAWRVSVTVMCNVNHSRINENESFAYSTECLCV